MGSGLYFFGSRRRRVTAEKTAAPMSKSHKINPAPKLSEAGCVLRKGSLSNPRQTCGCSHGFIPC